MKTVVACSLAVLLSTQLLPAADDCPPPLRIEQTPEHVTVLQGDSPVLTYQRAPKSLDGKYERAGYVHPLFDLDGNELTEDFPQDHPHHRGIFWAWHQLSVGDVRTGDPWVCKDFLTEVRSVEIVECCPQRVAFRSAADWTSPLWVDEEGTKKPIVRELTTIRVHLQGSGSRAIDFEIALIAAEPDVRIGGSEDVKGYGGFSPRIRLPEGLTFLTDWGVAQPQNTSVDPSPWLNMTAAFDSDDSKSGVTILSHPSVPGFPQRWILRQKRSMQNPVFPGREAVTLPTDCPLVFRYRMVLHRGEASADQIRAWQAAYSSE
jgi:hypothetical protein